MPFCDRDPAQASNGEARAHRTQTRRLARTARPLRLKGRSRYAIALSAGGVGKALTNPAKIRCSARGVMAEASGVMRGKRGLILGIANNRSIAWGIAKAA